MKCVIFMGKIERVTDEEAHAMVKNLGAQYVPKSRWKKEVRDA